MHIYVPTIQQASGISLHPVYFKHKLKKQYTHPPFSAANFLHSRELFPGIQGLSYKQISVYLEGVQGCSVN